MSLVRGQDKEVQVVKAELIDPEQTLGVISRAEIDMQVSTAHKYPRNREMSIQEAIEMVTCDQDTAEACIYAIPRGGKVIKGASIRMAEVLAYAWGNLHAATRITGNDGNFVTAQGVAWDLEKGVKISSEVKRSIKNKYGKTYDNDMQGVTANAAASIALRNSILRLIPGGAWKRVYDAAVKAALGDVKSSGDKRLKVVERLKKMGLTEVKIFEFLQVSKIEEITNDHLETLIGIGTAIKEGSLTIENAFTGELEGDLPNSADDLNKAIFKDNE